MNRRLFIKLIATLPVALMIPSAKTEPVNDDRARFVGNWIEHGSDGDLWLAKDTTIHLSRDMYFRTVTHNGGKIVANGYKVHIQRLV